MSRALCSFSIVTLKRGHLEGLNVKCSRRQQVLSRSSEILSKMMPDVRIYTREDTVVLAVGSDSLNTAAGAAVDFLLIG